MAAGDLTYDESGIVELAQLLPPAPKKGTFG